MPDAIHTNLADIQSSLTATHKAESPDGTVKAEATAKHQVSLTLTAAALTLPPTTLASLILETQREAQQKAEAALTEALDTYRTDPRVTTALDTLRDTQANPTPPPARQPTPREDEDTDFVDSVYNSDKDW